MAIRNIVYEGDPILRKKAKVVDKIDERIIMLLDDMAETMYENDGVGLAAPQVGILKRIVVIDVGEGVLELINPEILETKGSQIREEACLSLPEESKCIERPEYVKIKAQNRHGEWVEYEGTDLLAVAFCHETDHLDGVLFIDKPEAVLEEEDE